MKHKNFLACLIALLLVFATAATLGACGGSDEPAAEEPPQTEEQTPPAEEEPAADTLETFTPGKLTIATGNPAWAPWVIDDKPESGEGFEAALAYAVAEKLGFAKEDVVWVRTDFDTAIQPGPKDFDFNLQQYSVTEERKQVVDFSSSYYKEPLVVVMKKDSKFAGAKTLADLKGALFGAASGDIAVQFTTELIAPDQEPQVYNNLADVFSNLNSGQIDATILGLLSANYVVNIEGEQITDGIILGKIVGSEEKTEGLGLLLSKDNPLTPAVSAAVDALWADGTIDKLKSEWLADLDVSLPELQ
jgi:polar amino acid transport system substrate-binding protein